LWIRAAYSGPFAALQQESGGPLSRACNGIPR